MSGPVVLDTSAVIALLSPSDAHHARAVRHAQELQASARVLLLPADVITEAVNLAGKKLGHHPAVELAAHLLTTPLYTRVETSDALRLAALRHFQGQAASVSFTDCIVMAVADAHQTRDIFGFDTDFTKNGYTIPTACPRHHQAEDQTHDKTI